MASVIPASKCTALEATSLSPASPATRCDNRMEHEPTRVCDNPLKSVKNCDWKDDGIRDARHKVV